MNPYAWQNLAKKSYLPIWRFDEPQLVIFIPSEEAKDVFLANYEKEQAALTNFSARTIINNKTENVLVFGLPGGGKSLFAKKVQYKLNTEKGLKCSLLIMNCNESASSSDMEYKVITNELFKAQNLLQRWQSSGVILCLDELDSIAPDRRRETGDQRHAILSQKLMGYLGSHFGGCQKLITLMVTNYPHLLEEALIERANNSLYFPPIVRNKDAVMEIIRHHGLPEVEPVYEELERMLEISLYSGRGLSEACKRATADPIFSTADFRGRAKLLFRYLPPSTRTKQTIDDYEKGYQTLINQAQSFLELESSRGNT